MAVVASSCDRTLPYEEDPCRPLGGLAGVSWSRSARCAADLPKLPGALLKALHPIL